MILKKIEKDPKLSEAEKEIKKQQAIKPIIIKSKSDDKPEKPIDNKKEYKVLSLYFGEITLRNIVSENYSKVNIEDILEYDIDNPNIAKHINREKAKMDDVKFRSINECCDIIKTKYTEIKKLTPEEVSKKFNNITSEYQNLKKVIDNLETDNDKSISNMKKSFNKLNRLEHNENLTLYYETLNKYIAITKQYTQLMIQLTGFIGNNLKLVEVDS